MPSSSTPEFLIRRELNIQDDQYVADRLSLANGLASKRDAPDGATVIGSPFGIDTLGLELDVGAAYLDCPLAGDLVLGRTRWVRLGGIS